MKKREEFSIEILMMAFILLAALTFTCLGNLYVLWKDSKPKPPVTGSDIQATQTAYKYFYSGGHESYLELKYLGKYMGDLWLLDYEITNHSDIAFRTTVYSNKALGCKADAMTGWAESKDVLLLPGKSMVFTCNTHVLKTMTFYADEAKLMKIEVPLSHLYTP